MPAILVATPASAVANSYATVEEANAYHASYPYPDVWTDNTDMQVNALITATRLLDENVAWVGWQTTAGQALAWPRAGVVTRGGYAIASGAIPEALRNATAEFARLIIEAGTLDTGGDIPAGLKALKAGPVELQFDPSMTAQVHDAIPSSVWSMISFLVESRASSVTTVPLIRR